MPWRPLRKPSRPAVMAGRVSSRCRSEIRQAVAAVAEACLASSLIAVIIHDNGLDNDRFLRYVLVAASAGCRYVANFLQNVLTTDNPAEYRITPALHRFAAMVEEVVVLDVEEELGGSRVGIHGPRHGNGAEIVLQAIVGLVLDRVTRRALRHVGVETATLDHEVVDNAVKNCAIVMPAAGVGDKVLHCSGRALGVQLQCDLAKGCANSDHLSGP